MRFVVFSIIGAAIILSGCGSSGPQTSPVTTANVGRLRILNLTDEPFNLKLPSQLNPIVLQSGMATPFTKHRAGERSMALSTQNSEELKLPITIKPAADQTILITRSNGSFKSTTVNETVAAVTSSPQITLYATGPTEVTEATCTIAGKSVSLSLDKAVPTESGPATVAITFADGHKIQVKSKIESPGIYSLIAFSEEGKDHRAAAIRNDVVLKAVGESGSS